MTNPLVGVDLGGTLIRAATVTGLGTHDEPARHPTPAAGGPVAVLEAVAAAVLEATGGVRPAGVAMGVPGPLDPTTGLVYAAPNLPGWEGVEAGRILGELLGCAVALQNDANLAAVAEWTLGAGRGTRDFAFLTVSTGVGGGLILDGELLSGAAGTAGELGHVPAAPDGPPCHQGHPGCLEGVASGTAIADRARSAIAAGEPSSLAGRIGCLDARAVQAAAEAGDALARSLFDDAGRAVGRAIGGLINVLSPEAVAIGGGMLGAGELLFAPLRAAVPQIAFPVPLRRCRVVAAALGTDSGLAGASAWAWRRLGPGGR